MKHTILTILLTSLAMALAAQSLKDAFMSNDLAVLQAYISQHGPHRSESGYHPITVAAKIGDLATVQSLLDQKVDINVRDGKKRSALMYAAEGNHIGLGRFLLGHEPILILKDKSGKTAMDIANEMGNPAFAELIRSFLPHYAGSDGPHIIEEGGGYKVHYIMPGEKNGGKHFATSVPAGKLGGKAFNCYDKDGSTLFKFKVNETEHIYPDSHDDGKPIFAVSDIEGNLPALIRLLRAGDVMDEDYNWIFGEGHLVLAGDFFDRGDQVTECLWLIYKLEQEARAEGGKVHFIIGNHEQMNLSGDYRFVRMKYKMNAKMMGERYGNLFGVNTILGRWLRTKPAMVRIGDNLFLHAGLSSAFLAHQLDIAAINETVMTSIDLPESSRSGIAVKVLAKNGPLWTRDVARKNISTTELDGILAFYGAKVMIFGHTKVDDIQTTYGGKAINLDVHHASGPKHQMGLSIQNGKYEVVDVKGRRRGIR